MERRYLVATLALAATFAIFSGESYTRYLGKVPHSRAELKADIACAKQAAAKHLVAMLKPYVGRDDSAPAPMLADLSAPELPQTPAAAMAPERPKCPLAARAQRSPRAVMQMRVMADDAAHAWSDRSVVRAELLSDRAQEWQNMAIQRTMEINVRSLEQAQSNSTMALELAQRNSAHALVQAQRNTARALEQARRDIEKSHLNVSVPAAAGTAIHINFVTPTVTESPVASEPIILSVQ